MRRGGHVDLSHEKKLYFLVFLLSELNRCVLCVYLCARTHGSACVSVCATLPVGCLAYHFNGGGTSLLYMCIMYVSLSWTSGDAVTVGSRAEVAAEIEGAFVAKCVSIIFSTLNRLTSFDS